MSIGEGFGSDTLSDWCRQKDSVSLIGFVFPIQTKVFPYFPLHNSACNPQTQTTQIDAKSKISKLNMTTTCVRKMNVKKIRAPAQQSFLPQGKVSTPSGHPGPKGVAFVERPCVPKIFVGWEKFRGNREGKTKIFPSNTGQKPSHPTLEMENVSNET